MKKKPEDETGEWEEWFTMSARTFEHSSRESLIETILSKAKQVGRFGMENDRLKREIQIYERMLSLVEDAFAMASGKEE